MGMGAYKGARFRSCGRYTGRADNREIGDMLCEHDARFVRESTVNNVGSNVGIKGGDNENHFFCIVKRRRINWQGSRTSVV